jgi:hypothetical protein
MPPAHAQEQPLELLAVVANLDYGAVVSIPMRPTATSNRWEAQCVIPPGKDLAHMAGVPWPGI